MRPEPTAHPPYVRRWCSRPAGLARAQPLEEPRHGLVDERLERLIAQQPAVGHRGQAVERRPGDQAEALAVARDDLPGGLAAMANGGLLGDQPLEPLVDEAVARLLDGLRPRSPRPGPRSPTASARWGGPTSASRPSTARCWT